LKVNERPHRALRIEIMKSGLSRDDLAELTGIPKNTFSRKIMGRAQFTVAEAVRLKKVLNSDLTLEELFKP
jgi:plasmid maintenance system antidote protein VapI